MRPAISVILLTTLIGAGQGLLLALVGVEAGARLALLPPADPLSFHAAGSAVALALLAAGLVASFFHLGRPERAWRAAARWRSSWLSREVIVLPLLMALVAVYGLAHAAGLGVGAGAGIASPTLAIGALAVVAALALYVCTAMVYACMRLLAEWHTPLTLVNYTLLGAASGCTLASALAALAAPSAVAAVSVAAIVLTALAAVARGASMWRNARLKPASTLRTAIGIEHPAIRQMSQGFGTRAFATREFFHGASPRQLRTVEIAFVLLAFALPLALLALGRAPASPALLSAAFVAQYIGLLAERWCFFAEARHPQNLYHQAVS
jgi:DMSO reductase anchor subunit